MRLYTITVNNYQKGRYLPLYESWIISVEKIDRSHHKVVFKIDESEKKLIEKRFNKKMQPC